MVRARPHVVIARLNEEELRIYDWLLRSVAGVTYSRNRSRAFRTFLRRVAAYVKEQKKELQERYLKYLESSGWPDFEPPVVTRGPQEIEVEGPEEIEALEQMETY